MDTIDNLVRATLDERASEAPVGPFAGRTRARRRPTIVGLGSLAAAASIALVLTIGLSNPGSRVGSATGQAATAASTQTTSVGSETSGAYAAGIRYMLQNWADHENQALPADVDIAAPLDQDEQGPVADALSPEITVHWVSQLPQTAGTLTSRPGLLLQPAKPTEDPDRVEIIGTITGSIAGTDGRGLRMYVFDMYLNRLADDEWVFEGYAPSSTPDPLCEAAGEPSC